MESNHSMEKSSSSTKTKAVARDWSKVNAYKKRKRDILRYSKHYGDALLLDNVGGSIPVGEGYPQPETQSKETGRQNAEQEHFDLPASKIFKPNENSLVYESPSTSAISNLQGENYQEIVNDKNKKNPTDFMESDTPNDGGTNHHNADSSLNVSRVTENTYTSSDEDDSSCANVGSSIDRTNVHSTDSSESGDSDNGSSTFSIDDKIDQLSVRTRFRNHITDLIIILQIIATAIRARWTYASIILVFKTIKSMTVNSKLPATIKSLWKLLSRNDNAETKRHLYCRICQKHLGNGTKPAFNCECGRCGPRKKNKRLSYFIEMKIKPQLERLFANKAVIESLWYRFTRCKQEFDNIEDMFDATGYLKLCQPGRFLSFNYNFSFSLFTDGVKVSNSSNASAWPIMLMINELPPHARKKYMILAGIWVDSKHPNLNTFLKATVMELRSLYETGIVWTLPENSRRVVSKFVTTVCTADSKARAPMLAMTQSNGEYGCTYCYHKGEQLEGAGVTRVYPNESVPSLRRTDEQIRMHMTMAREEGRKVFGVQDVAAISVLQEFDLGSGAPVDSMHNMYLGVAKFHTSLMLNGKATDVWYARSPENIATINARLMKVRPPSRISRKPRPIEEMSQWKASEWRNWLQFYAVPCLRGVISPKYLKHLMLLSRAAYILNKSTISTRELETARTLLTEYVQKFERLFGKKNMRYNVHLLNHVADSVAEWGPFWTHSAFPYEAFNKKIIDKVTSANGRCMQIATRYSLTRFIENALSNDKLSYETKTSINKILTDGLKKQDYPIDYTPVKPAIFEGKNLIKSFPPTDEDLRALSYFNYDPPNRMSLYRKAIIKGTATYACEPKKVHRKTRYCDKYIYCKRIGFGEIKKIVTFLDNDLEINGFIVERLSILRNYLGLENIQVVRRTGKTRFILCDDDVQLVPAIAIEIKDLQITIAQLPNVWETD